eukprot:6405718-Alexandrium_andersonii.AAC.1
MPDTTLRTAQQEAVASSFARRVADRLARLAVDRQPGEHDLDPAPTVNGPPKLHRRRGCNMLLKSGVLTPVSYTHLTLPTICSV